ncbi:MAG: class I tRNA ligase family protein [Caldiserica bacterium]|nr:class I tRNA ligase family protein [Caldisericota bacterium]
MGEGFLDFWPADFHVIGKDIIRFHCIIWPALLKTLQLPLPKRIFSHGFISLKGEKISSTRGNILQPEELLKEYPADALRFYLFREIPFGYDGDFSLEGLKERYNQELANDWGNFVRRVEVMTNKYFGSIIPSPTTFSSLEQELISFSKEIWENATSHIEEFHFSLALQEIWKLVKRANQYIEETSPWTLHKNNDKERLSTAIYTTLELIRKIALLLFPFTPFSSSRVLEDLGCKEPLNWQEAGEWNKLTPGKKIALSPPLFSKK